MRFIGIALGLCTFLILMCARIGWCDQFYLMYNFVFSSVIRVLYDSTIGLLGFASVYVIVLLLISWIVYNLYKTRNKTKSYKSKIERYKNLGIGIINFLGWVIFLFYFLWGFNYLRPNLKTELALNSNMIDSTLIFNEYEKTTKIITDLRSKISLDTHAINMKMDWITMESVITKAQRNLLKSWGEHPRSNVRVRRLFPSGSLLSFSTAGIYNPFSLEGHIDPGLHTIQYPFTAAHEMAHGYGFTDEGECNFIGFLTCTLADDDFIKYSGWIGYWRYLHYEVKSINASRSSATYSLLPTGIKADLKAINDASNRYPDILPALRNLVYDNYLKANGVKSGMKSYSEIVSLSIWYQAKYGMF